jgi:hypothetical protein
MDKMMFSEFNQSGSACQSCLILPCVPVVKIQKTTYRDAATLIVITHEFEKPPKGFPNPPALC